MQQLNNNLHERQTTVVERIVQFGTGNFLRAFVDWLVHDVNVQKQTDLGVVIVQSTNGKTAQQINAQDGLYTVVTQGLKNGEQMDEAQVIECVTRSIALQQQYADYLELAASADIEFVVSNTTEAGIQYEELPYDMQPSSNFVANVTHFLYVRFNVFNGAADKGLAFLPCELIEANGQALRDNILKYAAAWQLPAAFSEWVNSANTFCNTLVDRIVPGFPKDQYEKLKVRFGYEDQLMVMAEPYYIWVIEAKQSLLENLPFDENLWNVVLVDDLSIYRERKVKVLNGAHSALTPLAILLEVETVSEALNDEILGTYVENLIQLEILPTIPGDEQQLTQYKREVIERFKNPFIKHYVNSIALNAISKFKARNIPSLIQYVEKNATLPVHLVTALAAWIHLYKSPQLFTANDAPELIAIIQKSSVHEILKMEHLWGTDLSVIQSLEPFVTDALDAFEEQNSAKFIAELV